MGKFEQMLAKKKDGKPMGDTERDAKMSVLEHVRQMAHDMMKDHLDGGLKKVSVASDSKQGLKAGLEHAKEMMGGDEAEESPEHEAQESPEEEAAESKMGLEEPEAEELKEGDEQEASHGDDDMSEDEIDAKLQELMDKKKRMASKKGM